MKDRYNMILEQKQVIKKELKALEDCYKEFEYKEWYYETAIKAGTEKVVENITSTIPTLEIDKIPKNERKDEK